MRDVMFYVLLLLFCSSIRTKQYTHTHTNTHKSISAFKFLKNHQLLPFPHFGPYGFPLTLYRRFCFLESIKPIFWLLIGLLGPSQHLSFFTERNLGFKGFKEVGTFGFRGYVWLLMMDGMV